MKRLYYLSPSITSAEHVSNDLYEQGVTDWRFHIISKDEAGLYSHHLNSANVFLRTDLIRFVERGLLSGGIVALFFAIPFAYLEAFTFGAWLTITLFSVLFGAWCGGVGGMSQENYKIQRFHEQITNGQYLIMVDVRKKDEQRIKCIMEVRHPEAIIQGQGSTFTNPFAKDALAHVSIKT